MPAQVSTTSIHIPARYVLKTWHSVIIIRNVISVVVQPAHVARFYGDGRLALHTDWIELVVLEAITLVALLEIMTVTIHATRFEQFAFIDVLELTRLIVVDVLCNSHFGRAQTPEGHRLRQWTVLRVELTVHAGRRRSVHLAFIVQICSAATLLLGHLTGTQRHNVFTGANAILFANTFLVQRHSINFGRRCWPWRG